MREELRIHSFIHFEGEIHHCFECGQIFKKKKLLQHHMKMHERPNFACDICSTLFKYKTNLMKHKKMGKCEERNQKSSVEVDSEKIAKIAKEQLVEITKNFSRAVVDEKIKKKMKKEPEEAKNYRPRRRKRKFKEVAEISMNFNPEKKLDPLKITKTPEIYEKFTKTLQNSPEPPLNKRSYTHHRPYRLSRPSTAYQCDLCDFSSLHKSKLLSHIRFHVSSNRHKCIYCEETFASVEKLHKHSLKAHQKGVYGSVEYSKMSFECETCQKTFSAERIGTHLELHRMEKLKCDHCLRTFRTKLAIERHMRTHEERKYACQTCGKSFKKAQLR